MPDPSELWGTGGVEGFQWVIWKPFERRIRVICEYDEDRVQESYAVLLALWEPGRFDPPRGKDYWPLVATIVRGVCYAHYSASARHGHSEAMDPTDPDDEVRKLEAKEEILEQLLRVMQATNEREWKALCMDAHRVPRGRIARILGFGGKKSLTEFLSRLRTRLRDQLGRDEEDGGLPR
ncbi:MAG: sigma-70 family RNA polymerase sigma factor [bacterium]|nr:sigma-70 family RNA polymerase sigma factor [bacterium]